MATYVTYNQPPNSRFIFGVTLDGQAYVAEVIWGLFGRRTYLNLKDGGGALIFSRPMLGSPLGVAIQSASWHLGVVTVLTALPHGFAITDTVNVAISGCLPEELNGRKQILVTTATEFTFPLGADPGAISQFGKVDYNIDIAGGYFSNSTLVYRPQSNQFEVSP